MSEPPSIPRLSVDQDAGPIAYRQCRAVGWLFSADFATCGTCFLIGEQWIATAGHVIESARTAFDFVAAFDYVDGIDPCARVKRALQPESLGPESRGFVTGYPDVDFTFVRLHTPLGPDFPPLGRGAVAAPLEGMEIVCIQHPDVNHVKSHSTGRITSVAASTFTHDAPVDEGSSGAPILDANGNLVGIHKGMAQGPGASIATSFIGLVARLPRALT